MKIAIIDLGTNTFNLLIRDTDSNELIFTNKISVRLGDGGLNRNTIAPAAFQRGLNAIAEHRKTIQLYGADEIFAFATSAVRMADNGREFARAIADAHQIEVNIIDGETEAELIYLGVKQAMDIPRETSLIVDIGGGSTEFIFCREGEAFWKSSFLLGSSRLLEKFHPSDPINSAEIAQLEAHFEEELAELLEIGKREGVKIMIGSSGSFDTLAAMAAHRFQSPEILEGRTSYTFDMYEYKFIEKMMLQSTFEQRLATPGMVAMRADLIVVACVQINFLIKRLGIQKLIQSAYALKEGVFATLENKELAWQKS